MRTIHVQPLTPASFAPYGDILGGTLTSGVFINAGTSERIALGDPDLDRAQGHASLNLYRARANRLPFIARELERHCLGSQSFIPLKSVPFVVIVALGDPAVCSHGPQGESLPGVAPLEDTIAAFWVDGSCGVTFRPGTWHHPLLAQQDGDFIVLERKSAIIDCEIKTLVQPVQVIRPLPHADQ
jgi:ureidoglycolate lyase